MGALHAGHLALVRAAHAHGDAVAVSIFVNPLQFNNKDDLAKYPRHPEEDRRMLSEVGTQMLLMPDNGALFRNFTPSEYDLNGLDGLMEGASRPGHFQGVVNVVERLFHYVRPDVVLFGEKDRQQLAVIRHVANQLRWPVKIVGHPTVRDPDGLALSSRNQRLSTAERQLAPVLYRALNAIKDSSFILSVEDALDAGRQLLAETPSVELDYLTLVRPGTLQPLENWEGVQEAVALIAAQVGPVRLIDNITITR